MFTVWMVFSWLWVFMEVTPPFFLKWVYLGLLYPSFAFDIWYIVCVCVCMCVCVCVCVCVCWSDYRFHLVIFSVNVCLEIFFCVCGSVIWNILVIIFYSNFKCVCVYIYIYIYIYICMLVSICVCVGFMFYSTWVWIYLLISFPLFEVACSR